MSILVTGATGSIGSAVIERLAAEGAPVRALTRAPGKYKAPAGVQSVAGDMTDIPSMRAALQGVDTLFLLNAVVPDELTQALATLGLAREAGIQRIVYLSVLNGDRFTDVPHFTVKYAVERAIEQFDLPATVLRPSYFMQNDANIKDVIAQHGVYPMALGKVGVSMVDTRDIADVAAASLLRRSRASGALPREVIELVGPDAITGEGAAAIWSEALGRPVAYGGDDLDTAEANIARQQPSWAAYDLRLMLARFHADGMLAKPAANDIMTSVLGRAPRSYRNFVRETVAAMQRG
ncbi:MAG: NmrA/HSCARG family protein [Luteibacter sp.]|uniref:NmrA/HSCARG family protein n=1 Tax=Luteibacter sp. TaxID=1886636 RepID=UPI0028078D3B|nr:NmrA/HSCARG family protein [Luteibacter sp.]MDQ7995613.1 NmrA/HSCARG family protein [Luteibacter sp.]MDQ8047701.1 NmrA/HSCARG family protein [Luteibacter sp.]